MDVLLTMALFILQQCVRFVTWFLQHTPEQQIQYSLIAVATLPVLELALFILKTLVTRLLRSSGLSHPSHYGYWPRVLPWRSLLHLKIRITHWIEFVFKSKKQATGGFASVLSVLIEMYQSGQIFLGLPWAWGMRVLQPIGLTIQTHLMIMAQSGAGKSVLLISMIALWKGSAFVIDPKGELWRRTYRRLARKKQVVVLSPYHPEYSGQINPLDCLDRAYQRNGESDAIRWAYHIAQAFIETPPGSKQPFFTDASRGYLVGLILFVYVTYPEALRHVGTVRDLIVHGMRVYNDKGAIDTTSDEARALLHKMMLECSTFSEAISGSAAPFMNASGETVGNLQATLQEKTKVLDIPSVRHMLARTTRPLHELKSCDDYVLFVEAKVTSIRGELKDIFRMLTNLVVYSFESEPVKQGQCLFVAEELNAQGYNSCIEVALPVARSFGLNIIAVAQDIQGLKAAYPDTYLAFLGNADATIWMSSAHPDNLKQLSETLGQTTVIEMDYQNDKRSYRDVSVMDAEQVGRFLAKDSGNMIVTRAGARPMRLKLDPYFKALPITAYDPDPDHRETLPRRCMRLLLNPSLTPARNRTTQTRTPR